MCLLSTVSSALKYRLVTGASAFFVVSICYEIPCVVRIASGWWSHFGTGEAIKIITCNASEMNSQGLKWRTLLMQCSNGAVCLCTPCNWTELCPILFVRPVIGWWSVVHNRWTDTTKRDFEHAFIWRVQKNLFCLVVAEVYHPRCNRL